MTKKDYERAAKLIQRELLAVSLPKGGLTFGHLQASLIRLFVDFFGVDNPAFDEERFRRACIPGQNVKARKTKNSE